jgi:hypothetical protein
VNRSLARPLVTGYIPRPMLRTISKKTLKTKPEGALEVLRA